MAPHRLQRAAGCVQRPTP